MTDELHRYWRSPEGRDAFEPLLDAAFERLFGTEPQETSGAVFGEIRAYRDFPEPDLVTFVTCGLGHFILSNSLEKHSGVRMEVAWTVTGAVRLESAKRVLECYADHVLAAGVVPEVDAVSMVCCEVMSQCGFSTPALLPLTNHWFEPEVSRVDGFYPLFFVELVALTSSEAAEVEADPEAFYASTEQSGFNATNPLRR